MKVILTENQHRLLLERAADLTFIKGSNIIFNRIFTDLKRLDFIKENRMLKSAIVIFQQEFPDIQVETKRRNQKISEIILTYHFDMGDYFSDLASQDIQIKIHITTQNAPAYGVYSEEGVIQVFCELKSFREIVSQLFLARKGTLTHELKHYHDDLRTNFKASQNYQYSPSSKFVKNQEKFTNMRKKYLEQPFEKNAFFNSILTKTLDSLDSEETSLLSKEEKIQAGIKFAKEEMEDVYEEYLTPELKKYILSRLYTSLSNL